MTQKPQPRRGLGRGLGSVIPTAPRPDLVAPGHQGPPGQRTQPVERAEPVEAPASAAVVPTQQPPAPGSMAGVADWIGVPLPGDRDRPAPVGRAIDPSGATPSPGEVP